MEEFYSLDTTGRAARLESLARAALAEYDIRLKSIHLITNETNCIFGVSDSDDREYVMRVTDPSGCHHHDEVLAEVSWLQAIHAESNIPVNRPIASTTGEYFVLASSQSVPEPRYCVLFERIKGTDLRDDLNPGSVSLHGALMARLHSHATTYSTPAGLTLRRYDRVFPYSATGYEFHEPVVLLDPDHTSLLGNREGLVKHSIDLAESEIARLCRGHEPTLIHHDLHFWNVMIADGKLIAIDFEDLILGHPAQDVAIALYYYRDLEDAHSFEEAFREGYETVLRWPLEGPEQLEVLTMARRLMLLNYCFVLTDPETVQMRPEYTERTLRSLEESLARLG